ncbi:MAG TPA: tetratricopeptide repeat protein [bacterium]|nr:tetratricopeptide repeat protein [bacterium]
MADPNKNEFTNITDLLRQTAESVDIEKSKADKSEEEGQINDIFTDFNFEDDLSDGSDEIIEDVIPFEEAVLLQKKKQQTPRWVIFGGLGLVTLVILIIGYIYGFNPLMYNYFFKNSIKYLHKNEMEKVNRSLNYSLIFRTDPKTTYINFAKECWKLNKLNEAMFYLDSVKRIVQKSNIQYFPLYNMYAKVYISKGEYETAKQYCDMMDKLNGMTVESLYNRGEISLQKNDLQEAVRYFEMAKNYKQDEPASYIKLRRIYLKLNEFDKALKTHIELQYLENAPPLDSEAFAALGQIYISKNQLDKAEQFYLKSIESNPNQPELYLQLARIYKMKPNPNVNKIMENYKKYLALKPDDALVLSDLGYMYYKKKDIKNAVLTLEQSLNLNPNIAETHYYIGKIYLYIFKEYFQAIKEFEESVELGLKEPELNFHLAYSFYYNSDYDKSSEYFQKLLDEKILITGVDTSIISYNLGNALVMNGDYIKAVDVYLPLASKFVYSEPQAIQLYNNIGVAFDMSGNFDSASTYYWKAIELQEDYLDKQKEDFVVDSSKKPKQNFKRLLSNVPKIENLKTSLEWEIISPEYYEYNNEIKNDK